MSDDLNKNAEFLGKHKDEEDPILIAQRYLNIFHQIHIFNAKRQQEFDDSLLELNSDIRILLSTLPGGSVLLEHISQIEEKKGIFSQNTIPLEKSASKQETKADESKDMHELAQMKKAEKNAHSTMQQNINISNNILKMLQQTQNQHEKDMSAFADALIKSQENMANVLKDVLAEIKNQPLIIQTNSADLSKPENEIKNEHNQNNIQPQPADLSVTTEDSKTSKNKKKKKKNKNKDLELPAQIIEKDTQVSKAPEKEKAKEKATEVNLQQTNEESSKFFGFTKKLFGSKKENTEASISADNQTSSNDKTTEALSEAIDTTPVSLDDIPDTPISLDDDIVEMPLKQEPLDALDEQPQPILQEKSEPTLTDVDSDDEWEWEYVEDSDENGDAPNSDDEWEYIEVPADNNQSQGEASDDDTQWEYVEEPVDEQSDTQFSQNDDTQWEYVEEPVDEQSTDNELLNRFINTQTDQNADFIDEQDDVLDVLTDTNQNSQEPNKKDDIQ